MGSVEGGKKPGKKNEPSVAFQFNAPVTGQNQTFITGDVGSINQGLTPDDLLKLDTLLQPLREEVQQAAPPEKREQAEEKIQELHAELSKGGDASASRLNTILDGLIGLVPGAASAVGTVFASPLLGALVGPVTKMVLEHIA